MLWLALYSAAAGFLKSGLILAAAKLSVHVFFCPFIGKTRRPVGRSFGAGTFLCRTRAHVVACGPGGHPLDAFAETAGISFRVSHALCAGCSRASDFSDQHHGNAHAES